MTRPDPSGLDIIIPISMDEDWLSNDQIISDILEHYHRYGYTRFALAAPGKGCRSVGYPPDQHFEERAQAFLEIKQALAPYGIECGWWNWASMKSGPTPEFSRMINADGTETPFSSCPLDPAFRERYARSNALFAQIAKPSFIILEDDYSIHASARPHGCFCQRHLQEFAARQGRYYTREELAEIFQQNTRESFSLLRAWRALIRDSLVIFAQALRAAVDEESPEIPIGYMQAGTADRDGDCTEAVCRALAGPHHIPFSRLYGTYYCGADLRTLPTVLYHPIYSRQHISAPFRFYHESDSYPHTRFFTAGAHMRSILGAVYSYGFDGSTFQTQQLLDMPNEEPAYAAMLSQERSRFNEVYRTVSRCRQRGVEICYDPFWNTADTSKKSSEPLWCQCAGLFGIPYTTEESEVAFWDDRQARYADDACIRHALSKGLFLDGDAAKCLCERGYGEYIGVQLGEDVADAPLLFDLGAKEVIREEFSLPGKGRNMPAAHMFAEGKNGKLLRMTVTEPGCEILSDLLDYRKNPVSPAMTRFENRLGGRVVVMGMTLEGNDSQALLNHRRQRLLQQMLVWCSDAYAFVKEAAQVFTIMNEAVNPESCGYLGMLTLINLGDDDFLQIDLHLPPKWREASSFRVLDPSGNWQDAEFERTEDGLILHEPIHHLNPVYLLIGDGSVSQTH